MIRTLLPCLLLIPIASSGQCTVDQVQDQWNGGTSERNLPGYYEWQSFTAGATGALCQVDLLFCNTGSTVSGTGTLNVYAGEGIGGALLSTQGVVVDGSIAAANQPCWQQWPIAAAPLLAAGQVYTFQFVPTVGGGLPDPYLIQIQLPGTYAGGHNYNLGPQGDCAFRTHVSMGSVGTPETVRPTLLAYPNPATDALTVETPTGAGTVVELHDADGRTVWTGTTTGSRTVVDMAHLAPGLYVLRAVTHGAVEELRVVRP